MDIGSDRVRRIKHLLSRSRLAITQHAAEEEPLPKEYNEREQKILLVPLLAVSLPLYSVVYVSDF
jgi:hypothetical protein